MLRPCCGGSGWWRTYENVVADSPNAVWLLINSYGAIEKVEVDGAYRVDTGHVVAFEGDLRYAIKKSGGWTASVLSGEGLVLEFTGKGTVWLQTRNLSALVGWISPHLPS